jgi:hypothetical protein
VEAHLTVSQRKSLLRACFSFLVPVARFLLRSGISFKEFSEISRVAFVKAATEDYGIRGRPTNASRIAAMTGIPRKDVRFLRSVLDDYAQDPRVGLSPLGDILQYWCTRAEFLDVDGQPLPLPFSSAANLSFEELVQKSAGDVPCGAIRVELMRLGAISEDEDGRLVVNRREIVPSDIDERLVTSIAFSLRALATTVAFNTDPKRRSPGRIERFVQSGQLTEAARESVRAEIRKRVTVFTEELDDLLSTGCNASGKGARIGVGVFFHEDLE